MLKTNFILVALAILCGLTTLFLIFKIFSSQNTLIVSSSTSNITPLSTPSPTINPRPTLKPTSKPTLTDSTLCLITIQGQQYDVTSLRSNHSGGDVFKCGTDMTAIYQNQHGSSLSRIQPYLYTPGSTPVSQNKPKFREGDDD